MDEWNGQEQLLGVTGVRVALRMADAQLLAVAQLLADAQLLAAVGVSSACRPPIGAYRGNRRQVAGRLSRPLRCTHLLSVSLSLLPLSSFCMLPVCAACMCQLDVLPRCAVLTCWPHVLLLRGATIRCVDMLGRSTV